MRIAIDARELLGTPTGVGRYLAQILAAWSGLPAAAAHEFILCAPAPVTAAPGTIRLSSLVGASLGAGTLWEQMVLPRLVRRARADVLFAPAYSGPLLTRTPTVVSIHDVSFVAHPEWFGWREGTRRRLVTRLAARRAARVLALTRTSRDDILRYLRVNPDRVVVTSAGVSRLPGSGPSATASGPRAEAAQPATASRVLFAGSIFTRRHVPALIAGFAQLAARHRQVSLDVVGDNRTTPFVDLAGVVTQCGVGDRIHLRSYVSDAALADLYRRADAFVWLSSYEGFGLTPLEALAAGIPIVVLDTPVAREVYGDAAIYVPDLAGASIAAALERALFDARERARVLDAARLVLARYSWRDCAARVLDALVASGTGR